MKTDSLPVACPLCGADDYRLKFPATAPKDVEKTAEFFCCTSHHLSSHGDIVQCKRCKMVYNNPQPDPDALVDIYKEVEDPLYLEESDARVHTFRRSLKQLHKFAQPPGKLLDVGCYTGIFMQVASDAGWETEGVELGAWAAKIAAESGIGTVYNVPLSEVPLPDGYFDVITIWDVIEHLTDPGQLLRDAYRLLKPGGVLAVSTHMVDSMAVKLMGTRYPFFMDMHVVHFSRGTMKRLIEEQGYEMLRIRSHKRILKTGYFLEKLYHRVPIGRSFFKWLSGRRWLADRFIGIGLLGLVNIYAQKPLAANRANGHE
ncbi:MAG: class I SAM-dependent methyltransferase [bacterium]|nr:class I SAM-dependent methyltransferase [bacterium]